VDVPQSWIVTNYAPNCGISGGAVPPIGIDGCGGTSGATCAAQVGIDEVTAVAILPTTDFNGNKVWLVGFAQWLSQPNGPPLGPPPTTYQLQAVPYTTSPFTAFSGITFTPFGATKTCKCTPYFGAPDVALTMSTGSARIFGIFAGRTCAGDFPCPGDTATYGAMLLSLQWQIGAPQPGAWQFTDLAVNAKSTDAFEFSNLDLAEICTASGAPGGCAGMQLLLAVQTTLALDRDCQKNQGRWQLNYVPGVNTVGSTIVGPPYGGVAESNWFSLTPPIPLGLLPNVFPQQNPLQPCYVCNGFGNVVLSA